MWQRATASTSSIAKDGDNTWIQLFPAGWFGGEGQKRWYIDAALAQTLIDNASLRVNDYLFDYEHQSLAAPQKSGPVPAAGWFKEMEWREGQGLFVRVNWTAIAASMIKGDEYRYVSPTFYYDEQGNVRGLLNAALTNMPVLDGMQRVAASLMFFENGEEPMNENLRLALCAIFGLGKEANEIAIQTAAQALQDGPLQQANCSSVTALIDAQNTQLTEKDQAIQSGQTQIAALSTAQQSGQPDPTKFVPVAVVDELRTSLASLSTQIQGDKVETLLTAALSDGRVMAGADADNMRQLGKQDVALMEKMIGTRQPLKALSQMQTHGMSMDDKGNAVLDTDSLAVCSVFGLDAKDTAKAVAQEMSHGAH